MAYEGAVIGDQPAMRIEIADLDDMQGAWTTPDRKLLGQDQRAAGLAASWADREAVMQDLNLPWGQHA
jgi:hypothetical protein